MDLFLSFSQNGNDGFKSCTYVLFGHASWPCDKVTIFKNSTPANRVWNQLPLALWDGRTLVWLWGTSNEETGKDIKLNFFFLVDTQSDYLL